MASIVISDLHSVSSDLRPAGSDLFMDSESFLSEISDGELGVISGGTTPSVIVSAATAAASAAITKEVGEWAGKKIVEWLESL